MPSSPKGTYPSLGLGTVQFGLPYGVSNTVGQTPPEQVTLILKEAWNSGIRILDTARAYGTSETVLGENAALTSSFKIVSKLPPLPTEIESEKQINAWVCDNISQSIKALKTTSLYGILIHNPLDALGPRAEIIFKALESQKNLGKINKYGASIYDSSQIEQILKKTIPDLLQIPINVFDQRLLNCGLLSDLTAAGIELHARSVFLQGLVLMEPHSIPSFFEPVRHLLQGFDTYCKDLKISKIQAALTFIKSLPIDLALVGVNTQQQLLEIVQEYNKAKGQIEPADFSQFKINDEKFVNPSLWR